MKRHRFRYCEGAVRFLNNTNFVLVALILVACFGLFGLSADTYGEAKQSTLTMTVSDDDLEIELTPSASGQFEKSSNNTITVTTDNFTGYTLTATTSGSTSLMNSNDDEIVSISSAIDESTFSTGTTYNNKWGFKPSQYVTTSGNIDTTVPNTNYLPAPSTTGDILAKTTSKNATADSYTISFATKIDYAMPAGEYSYTYVLSAVANDIVYNVTYMPNISGTVNSMPSPNPQALTVPGGTPVAESYGTLSSAVPTVDDYSFGGWCDVQTTVDPITHNYECSGTTYQPGDEIPIDQTQGQNYTLYAIWIDDPFPTVWSQMGACEFHGNTPSNITGTECTDYNDVMYIDTGIPLYSQANFNKDYEIHFKIDHYVPSENQGNDSQQTFVSDKVPSTTTIAGYTAPGLVVRRKDNNVSINSNVKGTGTEQNFYYTNVSDVSVYRINGVIYASINGDPLVKVDDLDYEQTFDLTTWFGGYPATSGCDGSTEHPCTTAKRFIEATLSNMYIKLGDFDESNLYTINFNANGGSINSGSAQYLVVNGGSIHVLPTAIRDGWLFDGWYNTNDQKATEPLVPTGSVNYTAKWVKSVSEAQFDSTSLFIAPTETETIAVTNASVLEPYTFTSNNTSIATVDSSTGVVTGVTTGVTTITMTGELSHDTRTIDVTVTGTLYTISFDSQGGTPVSDQQVGDGASFSSLPTSTKSGYTLAGWFTEPNGGGTELTTSTVFYSNTPRLYYADWEPVTYVCTIAPVETLHTETCNQTGSNGCNHSSSGFIHGDVITYGHVVSSTTMTVGDAYDCDVNNTGTGERFYYFGTANGNAKFVASSSIVNADKTYTEAIALLPAYANPNLVTFNYGDYSNTNSRFMTYPELMAICPTSADIFNKTSTCLFLVEKSNYANTGLRDGIWLEAQENSVKNRIQTRSRGITHGKDATTANAPRATIEVPLQYVEPYTPTPATTVDITFNPHGGSAVAGWTINVGDQVGTLPPAPTYADHAFQGWFTEATGGTQVDGTETPTVDTTYHAQWKDGVALANITNTTINLTVSGTETINVTNAADLEAYSFASNDTNVATVDSTTGAVTAVAAGSTTITMTGAQTGGTQTITVNVTAAPATINISFNPHGGSAVAGWTINVGDQVGTLPPAPTYADHAFQGWFTEATGGTQVDGTETPTVDTTYHAQWKDGVALAQIENTDLVVEEEGTAQIVVTNAADLEPYTFTSNNTSVATVDASGLVTGLVESITTITMTGTQTGATQTINVRVVTELETTVCVLAPENSLHAATVSGSTVTYGQYADSPTPQIGDAYDCDVDYDEQYDSETERFYYLGKDTNDNAVLVAYNSFEGASGWATQNESYAYAQALEKLPTITQWDNPSLIEQATGYAARFTTRAEVNSACSGTTGLDTTCPFMLEHSAYDSGGRTGLWLMIDNGTYYRIHSTNHAVASVNASSANTARPTIVVPYNLIEKYEEPPVQTYTVTFNSMGGSSVSSVDVTGGTALGTNYPSTDPTKTDNQFFGWYTTSGYTEEVTPETVVNGDVTYYAKWVGDTTEFPIVWSEKNACVFGGPGINVDGTYCSQPKNKDYVDTGIALYNATNYDEDYEVGFKVLAFTPSVSQETIFNEKYENGTAKYPGIMIRSSGTNAEMTHKISDVASTTVTTPISSLIGHDVKIVRQGGVVKYSFDGGELTTLQNISQLTRQEFNTTVWFGASATDGNVSQRQSHSILTDMYIRLGTYEDDSPFVITFDGNGGEASESIRTVQRGDEVGTLPTATRVGSFTFDGWFDENDQQVTASTIPNKSQTYHAEWTYVQSDVPVEFNTSNNALVGYYDIIENWTNGSANISQFNELSPINNSTWGDTSVLSEANFWNGLRANFEANNCDMQDSYHNASESKQRWNSGSVNCSKPKVFDTGMNEALNVYLYDTTTSTVGNKVYYTKSSNGTITNLVPGKTYKWEKASDTSVYGYITATADHGTRFIDATGTNSIRDLGGLEVDTDGDGTVDGTVKYEMLYRGGRVTGGTTNNTEITNLAKTNDNTEGHVVEYDVAGDQPAGFTYAESYPVVHYNFDYSNTANYNQARTAINAIMDDIIENGNPIFFHCRVGADRTGTAAYLLEGLLGVPDEARYREYELTHLGGLTDRTRYYKMKDSGNANKFVFMMGYVLTTDEIMEWYMKGSSDTEQNHPDADRIQNFRNAMIDYYSPSP